MEAETDPRSLNGNVTPTRGPRRKIGRYLTEVEGRDARDPLAVRIMRRVAAYLEQEAQEDTETTNSTPPVLEAVQTTLQSIQSRLDRIEKQGATQLKRPTTYVAAATKVGKTNGPTPKTGSKTKTATDKEKLLESRRSKEIVIQVANASENATLQLKSTRELVENIRTKAVEVVGVSHLPSGDLRIFTRTAKAKESLQADQTWLQHIAEISINLAPHLRHHSTQSESPAHQQCFGSQCIHCVSRS